MSEINYKLHLQYAKECSGLSEEIIDSIVKWFFDNGYTFRDNNFPTPLQKVIGDRFNLDSEDNPYETTSMTTILMYEDIIRNER